MNLDLVNVSVEAASTFAVAVDEVMQDYLLWHERRCKNDDKFCELYEYDYIDFTGNVIGVLNALLRNGILIDICKGIVAYLDAAGIDHEGVTHLNYKGCVQVLKDFADILLRDGAIDEIFTGDNSEFYC